MTDVDTQMHPSFFYNHKETVMLMSSTWKEIISTAQ